MGSLGRKSAMMRRNRSRPRDAQQIRHLSLELWLPDSTALQVDQYALGALVDADQVQQSVFGKTFSPAEPAQHFEEVGRQYATKVAKSDHAWNFVPAGARLSRRPSTTTESEAAHAIQVPGSGRRNDVSGLRPRRCGSRPRLRWAHRAERRGQS